MPSRWAASGTRNLHLGIDVADLVEEDGAAVGGLEEAHLGRAGAGEGPALVPEQLGVEQLPREAGAVQVDEGARAPEPVRVDPAGQHALPGTGLPLDEHRAVRQRHPARLTGQLADGTARPHERVDRQLAAGGGCCRRRAGARQGRGHRRQQRLGRAGLARKSRAPGFMQAAARSTSAVPVRTTQGRRGLRSEKASSSSKAVPSPRAPPRPAYPPAGQQAHQRGQHGAGGGAGDEDRAAPVAGALEGGRGLHHQRPGSPAMASREMCRRSSPAGPAVAREGPAVAKRRVPGEACSPSKTDTSRPRTGSPKSPAIRLPARNGA